MVRNEFFFASRSQNNLYCFNRSSLSLLSHIPLTSYLSFLSVLQINLEITKESTLHIPPNQDSVISHLFLFKLSKTFFFLIAVKVAHWSFINLLNKSFASRLCPVCVRFVSGLCPGSCPFVSGFSSESSEIYFRVFEMSQVAKLEQLYNGLTVALHLESSKKNPSFRACLKYSI